MYVHFDIVWTFHCNIYGYHILLIFLNIERTVLKSGLEKYALSVTCTKNVKQILAKNLPTIDKWKNYLAFSAHLGHFGAKNGKRWKKIPSGPISP